MSNTTAVGAPPEPPVRPHVPEACFGDMPELPPAEWRGHYSAGGMRAYGRKCAAAACSAVAAEAARLQERETYLEGLLHDLVGAMGPNGPNRSKKMTDKTAVGAQPETTVMQHTPGPWHVDLRHYGTERGHVAISADQHTALAQVVWQMIDDDGPLQSGIANAQLIAAAPDMANALRCLLRHAERVNEVLAQECGVRFLDDGPLGMARDALRMAAGAA